MKSLRATATASSLAFLVVLGAYLYTVIAWQRAPAPSAIPSQRSITVSWITGDWLINYSDGFVRRGAIGEVCRRLYMLASIDPVSAIIAIKTLCYAALCAALLMVAIRRTISAIELALFVSPAALPFEIYDPLGSGRKEIVLLAVFVIYVVADVILAGENRRLWHRWRFWFLLVALPSLTLIHEGLFFFFPFFVVYEAVKRRVGREEMLMFGIPFSIAAMIFLVSWMYRGDSGISAVMCSSLMSMSLDRAFCAGAIAALEHYDVYIDRADLTRYVALAAVAFGPLYWYAGRVLESDRHARMKLAMLLAVACTFPLYVLSEDWGRWMHVTVMLILVIVFACKDGEILLPPRRPALAVASVVIVSLYVIAWRLPHWIHSPLPMLRAAL